MQKYLSLDIGGTFIKYGLVDLNGNIEEVFKVLTPNTLDDFLSIIFDIVEHYEKKILGIGISTLGRVDTSTGTIYNGGPLRYLHELCLKKIVEDKFFIPCSLTNDAKAAVLAELWMGNLKGVVNGAALILGTGVGGGIVINGNLFEGKNYQAGELSLLLRQPDDSEIIGFSGSAVRFIEKATTLLRISDTTDGISVFKALKHSTSQELNSLFRNYCREIAYIISNLQVTLDLEKIVIGGGISVQPMIINEIKNQYIKISI